MKYLPAIQKFFEVDFDQFTVHLSVSDTDDFAHDFKQGKNAAKSLIKFCRHHGWECALFDVIQSFGKSESRVNVESGFLSVVVDLAQS